MMIRIKIQKNYGNKKLNIWINQSKYSSSKEKKEEKRKIIKTIIIIKRTNIIISKVIIVIMDLSIDIVIATIEVK